MLDTKLDIGRAAAVVAQPTREIGAMFTEQLIGSHLRSKFRNRAHCRRVGSQGRLGVKSRPLRLSSKGFTDRNTSVVQKADVAIIYRSSVRQNKLPCVAGGEVTNDTCRDIIPGSNGHNESTV